MQEETAVAAPIRAMVMAEIAADMVDMVAAVVVLAVQAPGAVAAVADVVAVINFGIKNKYSMWASMRYNLSGVFIKMLF